MVSLCWDNAFENLVNQECRKTKERATRIEGEFENLVNQECRKTSKQKGVLGHQFENLVNQECRKTLPLPINFLA